MTLKQLVTAIRTAWQSRPLAMILPVVALGVYWWTHGHTWTAASFPTIGEWIAGTALLTTKWEHITSLFVSPPTTSPPLPPPVDAPKVGLILLLGASLGFGACGTIKPPTPIQPVIDGIVDCSVQATHNVALTILDDAASALATGDWSGALIDLVAKWGEAAVACAVQEVGSSSNHKAMASNDPLEQQKAERARTWLSSRAIVFK